MQSPDPKRSKAAEGFFIYTILTIIFILLLWVMVYQRNFQLDFG